MEPSSHKIAICIGHSRFENGRRDGGAVSLGKVQEWNFNRELGITLQEKLAALGLKSFLVDRYQGSGYTASMKWLAAYLKEQGATLAVELHFNAATGTAKGHEWLYWENSSASARLASTLSAKFASWFPQRTVRGAKPRRPGDRGVEFLRLTHCPAVICEAFFGDNPEDWAFASNVDNQYLMAGAIAQAIKETLG